MNRPIGMQFQFGILKMGFETPFQRNTEEREGEGEEEEEEEGNQQQQQRQQQQ